MAPRLRRATGDLFIADVGETAWEEVDRLPAGTGAGANLGWRAMEGTHCTGLASPVPCNGPSLVLSIEEQPTFMSVGLPDGANGACASSTAPVYRVWNGRADTSHRYLTDRAA